VALFATSAPRGTEINRRSDITIDYLMIPASERMTGAPLGADFDVTPRALALVPVGSKLYAVDRDAASEFPLADSAPSSFVVDSGGKLLMIDHGLFGTIDEQGRAILAFPLPKQYARLGHSNMPGSFFLFGGVPGDYGLYRFREDGTYKLLVHTLPEPIVDVTDTQSAVYLATASHIERFDARGHTLLFRTPKNWSSIVSLAVPQSGAPVFFSTDSKVFVLLAGGAVSVINDSGGLLRLRGDVMYVLDHRRQLLYAAHPMSSALLK